MNNTAHGGKQISPWNTLLFALLLLFFLQLFGMWIESIYRISLVRLSPGRELFGMLLLLLPLSLFFIREHWERFFLWGMLVSFLVCRVVCPLFGVVGQVFVGGVGVSLFLILLAYAFSARYCFLQGSLGHSLGLAVLVSILLRSWGSSLDLSMEREATILNIFLAVSAFFLFLGAMVKRQGNPPQTVTSCAHPLVTTLGLFANFTLVYLVFSCPMVVCAWAGYAQLGLSGIWVTGAVAVSIAALFLLAYRKGSVSCRMAIVWNVILLLTLVVPLFAGRPLFPESPGEPAVFVNGATALQMATHYLPLIMSFLVVVNSSYIASGLLFKRPRNAVLPILFGMFFLVALVIMLILTNVWGYVPYGALFRNRFFLPFLIAGLGTLLPWVFIRAGKSAGLAGAGRLVTCGAVLIALLAVAGSVLRSNAGVAAPASQNLVILTYNMQQGSHDNGNRNYRQQRDLLRRINADIISLQESDPPRPSGGHVDAVRYFAESLGYYAYYGPGTLTGTFGTAILSRYPIHNPRVFFTYSTPDEIGTAVAEIDVRGTRIAFFSTHPAGGGEVMRDHVSAVLAEGHKYDHVIAAGDFNFTSRTSYYETLAQELRNSAAQAPEDSLYFHGGTGTLENKIDHIFVSPTFKVLESHYLLPPESETDHPAHWSTVHLVSKHPPEVYEIR